tara:strand:+ start:612 stop:1169 length:558 start_codon:yes stop_codon:yes gene_type:complete
MNYTTQNDLLLNKLLQFYNHNNNLKKMLNIINGNSKISLRIVDWFVTNYAKKNYTVYNIPKNNGTSITRIKVYDDYKLMLKSYSKRRFDPFCRWDRITIPLNDSEHIQTTIGQLNFFKWAIENRIIEYIEENLSTIDHDMNSRNNSRSRENNKDMKKTRKKREELSVSACRSIKREEMEVVFCFN